VLLHQLCKDLITPAALSGKFQESNSEVNYLSADVFGFVVVYIFKISGRIMELMVSFFLHGCTL
jgi:hypothetical protein